MKDGVFYPFTVENGGVKTGYSVEQKIRRVVNMASDQPIYDCSVGTGLSDMPFSEQTGSLFKAIKNRIVERILKIEEVIEANVALVNKDEEIKILVAYKVIDKINSQSLII